MNLRTTPTHSISFANRACALASVVAAAALATLAPCTASAQTCGQPAWVQVSSGEPGTNGPGARIDAAMAYDSTRHVLVLFGGRNSAGPLADTWEWDGRSWAVRQNGTGGGHPSARYWTSAAFDSARGLTVLVGGTGDGVTPIRDTWEWDGTAWTRRTTSGPLARFRHALAFDSARNVTVLFGGWAGGGNVFGDTWEWSGTAWTQRSSAGCPARFAHAAAFDSVRNATVVFGGTSTMPPTARNDTWLWNGTSWAQQTGAGPSARFETGMAFDSVAGHTVLFGGSTGLAAVGDVWTLDGTGWVASPVDSGGSAPTPRFGHATAFDAASNLTVVVGGADTAIRGDAWGYGPAATPVVVQPPADITAHVGGAATFTAVVRSAITPTYRWRKGSVYLTDDGHFTGVNTPTLTIVGVQAADAGSYRASIFNDCGTVTTTYGVLTVGTGCAGDFNGDGTINVTDFLNYLQAYAAGDPRADTDGNGQVSVFDFLLYVNAYGRGC